jgi:hypothetical protein
VKSGDLTNYLSTRSTRFSPNQLTYSEVISSKEKKRTYSNVRFLTPLFMPHIIEQFGSNKNIQTAGMWRHSKMLEGDDNDFVHDATSNPVPVLPRQRSLAFLNSLSPHAIICVDFTSQLIKFVI